MSKYLVLQEQIENKIFIIRGRKVMLDKELALLYGVETFNLNKAVKRNIDRFPEDFMFQLTSKEFESLIFQIGISKNGRGGRRYLPYAFTEHGVVMLSSVLNSERAIQVNIQIVRTFIKLRAILSVHKDIMEKIAEHDYKIVYLFKMLKKLLSPVTKRINPIGFGVSKKCK